MFYLVCFGSQKEKIKWAKGIWMDRREEAFSCMALLWQEEKTRQQGGSGLSGPLMCSGECVSAAVYLLGPVRQQSWGCHSRSVSLMLVLWLLENIWLSATLSSKHPGCLKRALCTGTLAGQLLTTNTLIFNAQILWSMAGEGWCLKLTRELGRERERERCI